MTESTIWEFCQEKITYVIAKVFLNERKMMLAKVRLFLPSTFDVITISRLVHRLLSTSLDESV